MGNRSTSASQSCIGQSSTRVGLVSCHESGVLTNQISGTRIRAAGKEYTRKFILFKTCCEAHCLPICDGKNQCAILSFQREIEMSKGLLLVAAETVKKESLEESDDVPSLLPEVDTGFLSKPDLALCKVCHNKTRHYTKHYF